MKIIHNIAISVSEREKAAFLEAGMELPLGFTSFQIQEDDPRWTRISSLAQRFQAVDTIKTKFSAAELNNAKYLAAVPSWHHGYPEPADDFSYLRMTFDLTDYCDKCGIGKRQVAPFRMNKRPTWGSKSILQLNWIFDEYFVKPDVWSAIFARLGISRRPVLLDRTGEEIDSVVQLEIASTVELQLSEASYEECPRCNRKKYLPVSRGFYPEPQKTDALLFKSTQYFGSGANAHRLVFVSRELYSRIKSVGLKGVEFKPSQHKAQ